MKRILSSLCLFAALSAGVVAHADDLYSYSFSGTGVSGAGTFTIPASPTNGAYQVTSITGQVNGTDITGLLPVDTYKNNDNLFLSSFPYLDDNGVSFQLANDAMVNIFYINGDWFFQGDGNFVLDGGGVQPENSSFRSNGRDDTTVQLDSFSFAPDVATTPEPSSFVLLGTGVLGVAGLARRRFVRA